MISQQIIFKAGSVITPDLAAKIAQCVAGYEADVYIRDKNMNLNVDSLIGILALNVHNGSGVEVSAEGKEAEKALAAVCDILSGK